MKEIDGGQLDMEISTLAESALEICNSHGIGQNAPLQVADIGILDELQTAQNEAISIEPPVQENPEPETDIPPDPAISVEARNAYGYTDDAMDAALSKKPHDLEGFYSLMEQAGYTVTRGKNITFSHPRQKRNIRMRSLPEEYREDAIREVLAGRRIHNPRKRRSPLAEQKAQLVSALEAKQNQGRGHYYDLSIQNQITKQQARALLYYQQHGFTSADDFEAFAESVEAVKQRRDALSAQITSAEKRLNEIAVLQKHITNYLKTKDIYAGYRASGYSKAYYEEHEDEIKLCKASKRAFDELLPSDTSGKTAGSHKKQLPSLKALRAEYAELLAMKKAAYPEYYRAKDEYRELLTYQANLARLFGIENVRSAPQREHQQEEK